MTRRRKGDMPALDSRARAGSPDSACSVGVLIDLELTENAGGHVKCWQRIAEAACHFADQVDLTVYFLGDRQQVIDLGENVRYVTLPPSLGTRHFGFLAQGGGHTDLAPYHRRLACLLTRHDIIHTTDIFAFAHTAWRIASQRGTPLITSLHTDLPVLTEIYTAEIVHHTLGDGALSRFVLEDLDVDAKIARYVQRKIDEMIERSKHVIVSNRNDWRHAAQIVGEEHVSYLRRGIDLEKFHPGRRDRNRLATDFGIPADCPVLLFVGRVDVTKKALFAAQAARSLIDAGHELRFLAVGEGAQQPAIARLLGHDAVMPGHVPQDDLAWVYASADVFVFPSESEAAGNVVLEARASGLPVVIADHPGTAQFVLQPGTDGFVLPTSDPALWHQTIEALLEDPARRREIGMSARQIVERNWPSWRDIVEQDLLTVWRNVRGLRTAQGARS